MSMNFKPYMGLLRGATLEPLVIFRDAHELKKYGLINKPWVTNQVRFDQLTKSGLRFRYYDEYYGKVFDGRTQ